MNAMNSGKRGMGGGQGRGGGRGRMRGPLAGGVGGTCLCSKCGHRQLHGRGVPCTQVKCPQCGATMIRE